jgi:hypothetical protein
LPLYQKHGVFDKSATFILASCGSIPLLPYNIQLVQPFTNHQVIARGFSVQGSGSWRVEVLNLIQIQGCRGVHFINFNVMFPSLCSSLLSEPPLRRMPGEKERKKQVQVPYRGVLIREPGDVALLSGPQLGNSSF